MGTTLTEKKMSDIKKKDNKGWSEADLTWETIFLPG